MICKQCGGTGKVRGIAVQPTKIIELDCLYCNGHGTVSDNIVIWEKHAEYIKQWIKGKNLTLRKAAKILNIDAANLSKAERGIINPSFAIKKIKQHEKT